jgi:hypothetical protein
LAYSNGFLSLDPRTEKTPSNSFFLTHITCTFGSAEFSKVEKKNTENFNRIFEEDI